MKDYFYLDELAKGEKAEIALTVKLEGETQGNTYQDTLGKIADEFCGRIIIQWFNTIVESCRY